MPDRRGQRRHDGRLFFACLAASMALHVWGIATGVGVNWVWRWWGPDAAVNGDVTRVLVDETPFGSGGTGEAMLASDRPEPQVAEQWELDQPLLAVADRPSLPEPTWDPLRPAAIALPNAPGVVAMASLLSPPEPPEEPLADETDPAMPADDRESSPFVAEPRETRAVVQAGRVVSQEGIDFKLVGLRAGLTAYLDRAFLAGEVRVTLEIVVDEEGTPLRADVVTSSGRTSIDSAIQETFFNSWFGADPGEPFRFTLVLK
jgi:hypothetical protein